MHLLNLVIYHWVGNLKNFLFQVKPNCIFRTSGEGVEDTLIVQFGIKWMKATTDALQDKKEEDDDPSQVKTDLSICSNRSSLRDDGLSNNLCT